MTNQTMRTAAAAMIAGAVMAATAATAHAEVSSADRRCIMAFNKGVRQVAKAQGQIVRGCLRDFAAGRLAGSTPEDCVRSDPSGRVNRAVTQAVASVNTKCAGGLPAFGVAPVGTALARAALSQIDLMHGTIGRNLDTDLIASAGPAACQSQVGATLLKCEDVRLRTFLKCQKVGLRQGLVIDAPTLTATCLGTAGSPQPDPNGRIQLACNTKVADAISRNCGSVALLDAFDSCDAGTPSAATACLRDESACQLCRLLNDVDGLARDCDQFDDGDGANGSCGAECADGILQEDESCDDGNSLDLDGCSASCTVEGGSTCTGQPSVCTPNCGNGALDAGETCDDGNTAGADGCSPTCFVDNGYSCSGAPSTCSRNCGNGVLESGEGEICDDGDGISGDGCSSTCHVEGGYQCLGQPSVCTFVCGNGTFQPGETCDDSDAIGGDGCSAICQIEAGWLCAGMPSLCGPICGDGIIRGGETCDDGDVSSGNGCSFACITEPGFHCTGEPSNCLPVCGDGFIRGSENCDDGDNVGGDGCSATFCRQEAGFHCVGQPSLCTPNCGDGTLDPQEECDDGDTMSGDGCTGACLTEPGYACGGQPSVCFATCGNGVLNAAEACDDGNVIGGDGCGASCQNESGWLCNSPGQACAKFEVFIDSPLHGVFTTSGTATISGHYSLLPPGQVAVTVNGTPASSVNEMTRTFSHTVPLNAATVFNPVRVTLTNTVSGDDVHDRIVVIRGQSVADGAYSPQSVAMRLNDSGLDSIEPLVAELAAGQLDLATILPSGTVLIDDCFISVIGCWGSAKVKIGNPPPSFNNLTLGFDSKTNAVFGDIRIANLRVDVDIDGSGLVPDCSLRLTASAMQLTGDYALEPLAAMPTNVDVNLVTPMGIVFTGFNHQFTSGLCNAPIIGDIIQGLLPDIQQVATDGIRGFLNDPDGSGPSDSPIADAIEDTLGGVNISGAIGSGVGLTLDAPLFQVAEDNVGLTLGANARFLTSIGSGPGQCLAPPGVPNLLASYSPTETFPTFGANTPVGNTPYGLGISVSTAGFNQLLRGQTECGLMRASLTEIDLDGEGGSPPLPITSDLLSLLVPEFGQLPPATTMRIDIAPTLAPIVTGVGGPGGELTELKVSQVEISLVEPGPETVWLRGVLDARLGMDLAFLPDGSGLAITIARPVLADIAVAVIDNPLGTDEAQVETVLPAVIRPLIPQLAGALAGFPLPQFFGLSLQGVEVSRNGQFLSLFANLAPTP